MSIDDLSPAERDRRFNHWEQNDMDRCKDCGSWINDPDIVNGTARYYCKFCDAYKLEYRG
ncbi:MAG: hypothetical protein ABEI52_09625 [Halobacteriaceae archaeon]